MSADPVYAGVKLFELKKVEDLGEPYDWGEFDQALLAQFEANLNSEGTIG